jgi:hypothetical protein
VFFVRAQARVSATPKGPLEIKECLMFDEELEFYSRHSGLSMNPGGIGDDAVREE